jgi:fatty-acyl-CoA synthase
MRPMSRRVMNLAHSLTQAAARHPERPAIVWGERSWTWRAFDARVSALAAALRARGIAKGDRLLVHARNGNAILEIMYAAFRLGAVFVPTNFRLMPGDVSYLASQSGATAFLCHADYPEHVAAVREACPSLRHVVVIGEGPAEGEAYEAVVASGEGQAVANEGVEHDDPCWFFYTSGTTGKPKAAVLTHGQMAFVITNHLCDLMPGTSPETDASLVVAPLSHGAGVHAVAQVARAVTSVLPGSERFDAAEVWGLVARHRVTNMFTVPTILKMMVEHPAVDAHDHSSLRYIIYAGAPMYREDQKRALRSLGKVIVQYFGLGEVTGNITVLPPALHEAEDGPAVKIGTCGFERTGMQVQIQDGEGREVAPGETGEICVCGPAVFAGYWENPKANADAFRGRVVPHRRPRLPRRRALPLHHGARLRHVHLGRLQHLSARDRGEDPGPSGGGRDGGARRAGPDLGRDRHRGLRPARGHGAVRGRRDGVPVRQGRPLQAAPPGHPA